MTTSEGDLVGVVQAWQYSTIVGQLTLTLQNGETQSCSGTPNLLVGNFTRDGEPITATEDQAAA